MLDDSQPKTRPSQTAAAGFIDSVETLEEARQVLRGDAVSIVGDLDAKRPAFVVRRNCHVLAISRVFDGVVDQVDQRLLDQRRVEVALQLGVTFQQQRDLLRIGPMPADLQRTVEYGMKSVTMQRQSSMLALLLDARQRKEVLDDGAEAIRLA